MITVEKPCYRVVAALLERGGRYLITQRRPEARLPLLWEFPGGKVELGETDHGALRRELMERIGVQVSPECLMLHVLHHYDGFCVDLWVYCCVLVEGEPRPLGVHALRWVGVEELGDFQFPGPDQETVDLLLEDEHRFS